MLSHNAILLTRPGLSPSSPTQVAQMPVTVTNGSIDEITFNLRHVLKRK